MDISYDKNSRLYVLGETTYTKDEFLAYINSDMLQAALATNLGTFEVKTSAGNVKKQTDGNGVNVLLYGIPGCGKSYYINENFLKGIPQNYYERTVFYPDYTYSDFVGQILPKKDGAGISYDFVPGPFTRIMKKAINEIEPVKTTIETEEDDNNGEVKQYYLIIEEINRGNAPAIFGEIFQLLDRNGNGESEYEINNADIARAIYLKDDDKNDPQKVKEAEERPIKIPSNLTILATMNTADQNVFTLDTAFKRRWKMKCIRNNIDDCSFKDKLIYGTQVSWGEFVVKINEAIAQEASQSFGSDDKRIGSYFVKEKDLDDLDSFAEKVLLYLRNDVFKFNMDAIFKKHYNTIEELIDAFKENGMSIFKTWSDQQNTNIQNNLKSLSYSQPNNTESIAAESSSDTYESIEDDD